MSECINVLVVSDDHGKDGFENAFKVAEKKYGKIQYVIHAGDIESRQNCYYEKIAGCPVYIVRGNNDYNDNPVEIVTDIGGLKIFVTHGHKYGVYLGLQNLYYAAKERQADIAIYGHTHHADYVEADVMKIVNPGSLTEPRGSKNGSFAMLIIENCTVKIEHIATNW